MKKILSVLASLVLVAAVAFPVTGVKAKPTDEILNYTITVDVNDDATLNMLYHIEWKVLDDSIGDLDWVQIGIPNANYRSCTAVSDNIKNTQVKSSGSEVLAQIYFKNSYSEDDIVNFDFMVVQDYMYEMNILKEGETVFYFTPGWFKDIAVDNIEINWNADKATSWSHGATAEDGRLTWKGSLSAGAKFNEVSVTYPSDAFAFDTSKTVNAYDPNGNGYQNSNGFDLNQAIEDFNKNYNNNYDYSYDYDDYYDYDDFSVGVAFMELIPLLLFWIGISVIVSKIKSYFKGTGFSSQPKTTKKITRTLIKYYPECPGCAAPRPENAEKCAYCGRSFIESEEVVEEKEITNPENYSNEGTYRYGSSPNTFIRVHVTHIPAPPPPRSSCAHSSCAHSSCACAHSCACACACACAGGGRAGCSTKDFYNTNLKLRQLKLKKQKKQTNPDC